MTSLPIASDSPFWEPSDEVKTVLEQSKWICSYSGGKDSTSLVTWIEWLRRTRRIKVDEPKLVFSNTRVEFPFLDNTSKEMMAALRKSGWHCEIVEPSIPNRLYNQIFGRGLLPVLPSTKGGRWCTRSTKVDPMGAFFKHLNLSLMLTGIRWGGGGNQLYEIKRF